MNSAEQFLRSIIQNGKSPCVQYEIFNRGSSIFKFQDGFADIARQIKVTDRTTFHAYSVTKTFTALAVLQLAEHGLIRLDDSAKKYLPDFPYYSEITIRHLLTHTAGIPNPIPLKWIHLVSERESFNEREFFKLILEKNKKTRFKPNEKFAYSNLGYILLSWLIEKVSGENYQDYIATNIIKRLGLENEGLGFTINENHAKGYHPRMSFFNLILGLFIDKSKFMGPAEGKWKPFLPNYVNGSAYGGLIGTSNALAKYIRALLKPDSVLISDSYKKMLFTENQTTAGKPTGMCLSWYTGKLNGNTYFTHAGGGGGYYCEIRIYPEAETGSVIMFNRTGMTDERFLNRVDKFFLPKR